MAESTEVKPYQLEPTAVASYSDNESDSDKSNTDKREQASFTERLGSMGWCSGTKCYQYCLESSASVVGKW